MIENPFLEVTSVEKNNNENRECNARNRKIYSITKLLAEKDEFILSSTFKKIKSQNQTEFQVDDEQ